MREGRRRLQPPRPFIGSEGTLGIVTQIVLKLIPKPQARRTLLAIFDKMEDAAETVSAIIAAKIIPCTLEFLDAMTINSVEDYAKVGLPRDAAAILLMETDGPSARWRTSLKKWPISPGSIMPVRSRSPRRPRSHSSSPKPAAPRFSALARVAPTTILEDATVPRSELAKTVKFIQETADRYGLKVGTFGHMGDGNLHPTFLTNEKNEEEMHRVESAMKDIFDFAVGLGGTITGEHGVGVAKKPFLAKALGDLNISVMRQVKKSFDPKGILNPGKIFDL